MFPHFSLSLVHPIGSDTQIDLDYIKTVRDGRGLVRHYSLPKTHEALIGEEVQIKITYDSVIPAALTSFKLFLPWLTDACDAVITVNGSLTYFVCVPQALDDSTIKIKTDPYADKMEAAIKSKNLLIPQSAVTMRWALRETSVRDTKETNGSFE